VILFWRRQIVGVAMHKEMFRDFSNSKISSSNQNHDGIRMPRALTELARNELNTSASFLNVGGS